jgi:hypothetical protein
VTVNRRTASIEEPVVLLQVPLNNNPGLVAEDCGVTVMFAGCGMPVEGAL